MNNPETESAVRPSFFRRCTDGAKRGVSRFRAYYAAHPKMLYLFCFLLPLFLMTLVYALMQVYPFGKSSVLVLDLNGQYVYFFEGLRDLVYGNGSVLYSFSRAMGGEFMGMYAYYLASPFSYLVALFPKENITEALFFMFVLKAGCCGLTMGIYLDRVAKTERMTSVIFSTLYALCTFAVVMQHNTMWTDNLILLPLIALGIEEIIHHRKYKLYTVCLTIAIMSNFYIGYMMCIFVVIYCCYAYFGQTREERNPLGEKRHFLRCLGMMALFSIIALLISALIWIPTYYSLQFGKSTFDGGIYNENYYSFTTKFDLFNLVTKCFFGSYDTVDYPGLPFLYCGTVAFVALPFFFLRKDVRLRKKLMSVLAAGVLVFSFNINTLDKIWHGFQAPNWLNFRYAFMLVFLLLIMAAKGFDDLRSRTTRAVLAVAGVYAVLLCLSSFFENEHIDFLLMTFPSLLFLSLTAGMLILVIKKKKWSFRAASVAVLILVAVEMTASGVANLAMLNRDVVITNRNSYRDFVDRWQPAVDYVQEKDDGFYRMEKTVARKYNDAFALGYRGLSGSTSTLNAETVRFLSDMGHVSYSHHSAYHRPMPVSDSFFSIRYVLTESNGNHSGSRAACKVSSLYEFVDIEHDDGISEEFRKVLLAEGINVYYNPYALPIAFAVHSDVKDLTLVDPATQKEPTAGKTFVDTNQPCARFNVIFSAMLGKETQLLIPMKPVSVSTPSAGEYTTAGTNVRSSFYSDYTRYTTSDSSKEASVTFTFYGMGDNEVYFYAPVPKNSSTYLKRVSLYLDDSWLYSYYTSTEYGIIDLGAFPDGEAHTLEMRIRDTSVYISDTESCFYYLDMDLYRETFTGLQEGGIVLDHYTEDAFYGTVNVPEGCGCLFTTIAFDRGWNVRVDGEPVEIYETLDALLAFDITPGEHTVEMVYFPACYRTAILCFVAGVVLFAGIITAEILIKRKKNGKKKTCPCAEAEAPETGAPQNAPGSKDAGDTPGDLS